MRAARSAAPLLAALLAVVGLPRAARAQLAVDQLELVLAPADSVGVFTVLNDSDQPVQATLHAEDWDRTEGGENRFFPAGTLPQSCGARLQVFPRTVHLEPHARQSVRVGVTGDGAAASRAAASRAAACWSVIFVEAQAPRAAGTRAISYVLRTGVKVYVEPPGLPRDGVVEAMRVESMRAEAGDSARAIALAFRNTGGVHVVARGTVELRRPDNTVAASVPVPELYALPGALRRVSVPLPALAPGRYVAIVLLDFGGAELAAGQIDVVVP